MTLCIIFLTSTKMVNIKISHNNYYPVVFLWLCFTELQTVILRWLYFTWCNRFVISGTSYYTTLFCWMGRTLSQLRVVRLLLACGMAFLRSLALVHLHPLWYVLNVMVRQILGETKGRGRPSAALWRLVKPFAVNFCSVFWDCTSLDESYLHISELIFLFWCKANMILWIVLEGEIWHSSLNCSVWLRNKIKGS